MKSSVGILTKHSKRTNPYVNQRSEAIVGKGGWLGLPTAPHLARALPSPRSGAALAVQYS